MEQKDIFQHIKEIKPENRLNTHLKNKLDIRKNCYTEEFYVILYLNMIENIHTRNYILIVNNGFYFCSLHIVKSAHAVTCIKMSLFSCPVIGNLVI